MVAPLNSTAHDALTLQPFTDGKLNGNSSVAQHGFHGFYAKAFGTPATDTVALATWILFGKLLSTKTFVGLGDKLCRKKILLCEHRIRSTYGREN